MSPSRDETLKSISNKSQEIATDLMKLNLCHAVREAENEDEAAGMVMNYLSDMGHLLNRLKDFSAANTPKTSGPSETDQTKKQDGVSSSKEGVDGPEQWKEHNREAGRINATIGPGFLAPMKDVRDGSWITSLVHRSAIENGFNSEDLAEQRKDWIKALNLEKVCEGLDRDRQAQVFLGFVEGKLDENGMVL